MARASKAQRKAHERALDLINSDRRLKQEEIEFVYQNFNEAIETDVNPLGAFFTPLTLAYDTRVDACSDGDSIIDLCAGIGVLTWANEQYTHTQRRICVEWNPRFVEVGKRLVPDAEWYCMDIFDPELDEIIGPSKVCAAVSNPPFGKLIKTGDAFKGRYTGRQFEYKVIERAMQLAEHGMFILPKMSVPFIYSGAPYYRETPCPEHDKFMRETELKLVCGAGVDTTVSLAQENWKNTNIGVEIAIAWRKEDW